MISLIITAAGKGARTGLDYNKMLYKIDGETVLEKVFNVFKDTGLFEEYIVTANESDLVEFRNILPPYVKIVIGGSSRTQSVHNAVKQVTGKYVLIHDGARPFVSKDVIKRVVDSVIEKGTGITAIPTVNTLCKCTNEEIESVLGKDGYYQVQTPQGFITEEIAWAFDKITTEVYPDESSLYLKYIGTPHLVLGEESNVKLTYKEDLTPDYRFGVGYDTHQLVENRKLILGGVEIPHDKGLLGHSDADVLTHAIMDAMLSALSLRDIGYHFPDNDEKYKGASSILLLKKVMALIEEKGYKVKNVSASILAQKPKLLGYIPAISENLAKELGVTINDVGIGATTTEKLGFVGREEGIAVHATALLIKK